MKAMYEFFEHTADLGLRMAAPDLDTLFGDAAHALFAAIVEDLTTIEPREQVELELEGDEYEYLLFDWLRELLYRFDTDHLLFGRFEVHVGSNRLKATARGEPLD